MIVCGKNPSLPYSNKVSKFISNPLLRAVIGQTTSSFDIRWLMDTGKILLCNLSKGALGEDVSSLLGSLIVSKLSLASLSGRTWRPVAGPFFFTLMKSRRSPTGWTSRPSSQEPQVRSSLDGQDADTHPEGAIEAVFGNCATIISIAFRVSGDDAKALVREFAASGEGPRSAEQMFDVIVPASPNCRACRIISCTCGHSLTDDHKIRFSSKAFRHSR